MMCVSFAVLIVIALNSHAAAVENAEALTAVQLKAAEFRVGNMYSKYMPNTLMATSFHENIQCRTTYEIACVSTASVKVGTASNFEQNGTYRGVEALINMKRKKPGEWVERKKIRKCPWQTGVKDKSKYEDKMTWDSKNGKWVPKATSLGQSQTDGRSASAGHQCLTANCRCNPYLEVVALNTFVASKIVVDIDGQPICNNKDPKDGQDCIEHALKRQHILLQDPRAPNLHVVLLSCKADCEKDESWTQRKEFFFYEGKQLSMPVERLDALRLRIMFSCTHRASKDSPINCFNGWPLVAEQPDYRKVRVQVLTETSSFGWNNASIRAKLDSVIPSFLPVATNQEVNCTQVNFHPLIVQQFKQWRTPANGHFVQDPDENSAPITLTKDTTKWSTFASKRLQGIHADGRWHYTIEKHMLCFQRAGSSQQCCVQKTLNMPHGINATVWRAQSLSAWNTAQATLRNF